MFIEKLSDDEIANYLRKINLKLDAGISIIKTFANKLPMLVVNCKRVESENDICSNSVNWSGFRHLPGGFSTTTLVITDFLCYNALCKEKDYSTTWRNYMSDIFGVKYEDKLNEFSAKQNVLKDSSKQEMTK